MCILLAHKERDTPSRKDASMPTTTVDSYGPAERIVTTCKVVYLPGTDEWQVKAYSQSNMRYAEADYFTDDKEDALSTMIAMLDNTKPVDTVVEYNPKKR